MAEQSKKSNPKTSAPKGNRALARQTAFWIPAVLISLFAAWNIALRPDEAIVWVAALILAILLARHQIAALYLFLFLPVAGELARLAVGPGNGLLPTDLFIPFFIAFWLARKLKNRQTTKSPAPHTQSTPAVLTPPPPAKNAPSTIKPPASLKPLLVFCAVATLSLIQSLVFLTPYEVFAGSFYLIRFLTYALLITAVADIIKTAKQSRRLFTATIVAALLIAVAGFIQLAVYPDLGKLEEFGWDPHINRLVSTWLDPNFIGGYLAFISCVIFGVAAHIKNTKTKTALYLAAAVLLSALFLTYSRSAYLAAAAGVTVLGVLKSRQLLIAFAIVFLLAVGLSPRAEQRVTDLTHSISSFIFNTSENPDATARLRVKSWEQTVELIAKRPLLGSGYNTLRAVNYNEGYVSDPKIHSASGSDSSLLTVLATTGILGFAPFIWLLATIFASAFKKWRNKNLPPFTRGLALGLVAGLSALFCHAFFVNSLFFPQILIPVAIIIGLSESGALSRVRKVER